MKNQPKSIPKTMKNRHKFHARKSDAKNIEKHNNWSRKDPDNEEKTIKKRCEKLP
jgi:hypothetical protein